MVIVEHVFKFIKAVSDIVFNMINAVYHASLACLSWLRLGEACLPSSGSEYKLLNTLELIKAVSDTVFNMINAVYHDKSLMFIVAKFWEKLVPHYQAVNEADSFLLMRRVESKPWR